MHANKQSVLGKLSSHSYTLCVSEEKLRHKFIRNLLTENKNRKQKLSTKTINN